VHRPGGSTQLAGRRRQYPRLPRRPRSSAPRSPGTTLLGIWRSVTNRHILRRVPSAPGGILVTFPSDATASAPLIALAPGPSPSGSRCSRTRMKPSERFVRLRARGAAPARCRADRRRQDFARCPCPRANRRSPDGVCRTRDELLQQTLGTLRRERPDRPAGLERAASRAGLSDRTVVASIQSLWRPDRLGRYRPEDWPSSPWTRCTGPSAASYLTVLRHFRFLSQNGQPPRQDGLLLGTTASSRRTD
jgi:hypothetical protein